MNTEIVTLTTEEVESVSLDIIDNYEDAIQEKLGCLRTIERAQLKYLSKVGTYETTPHLCNNVIAVTDTAYYYGVQNFFAEQLASYCVRHELDYSTVRLFGFNQAIISKKIRECKGTNGPDMLNGVNSEARKHRTAILQQALKTLEDQLDFLVRIDIAERFPKFMHPEKGDGQYLTWRQLRRIPWDHHSTKDSHWLACLFEWRESSDGFDYWDNVNEDICFMIDGDDE